MEFSYEIYLFLFFVSLGAGCIDTIAGGGGLITLPAMLLVGMPPASALATNKLQGSVGNLVACIVFFRDGLIDMKSKKLLIIMTFLGSILGGWLVLRINTEALQVYVPILLITIACYFLFSPNIGEVNAKKKLSYFSFSIFVASSLGFYDGFFGPGTGALIALAFVSLYGVTLLKATAYAKLLNLTSQSTALLYFIIYGEIFWLAGIAMMAGQVIGAILGAKMVINRGAALVRPVIVSICILTSGYLLYANAVAVKV